MPEAFDNCVKKGGRVRTISLSGNKYKRVCYLGGKSYSGHTKTKKASPLKQKG